MQQLTRWWVFEVYLEPPKDENGDEMYEQNSMTHREASFMSLQAAGDSWLKAEKKYQDWMKQTQQGKR